MLRLNEIKLPLNHAESALVEAILARLCITADQLLSFSIFRRAFDARKKTDIQLVYSLDVELRNEAAILAAHANNPQIRPSPDMSYQQVAQAPANLTLRPVVIGTGPCGLFAALLLAQMGFKPISARTGQSRTRTHSGYLGLLGVNAS
jgi:uncharacterized FAD-dependent dehydrogenase